MPGRVADRPKGVPREWGWWQGRWRAAAPPVSQGLCKPGTVITISQTRKPRQREVEWFVQGHTASKRQSGICTHQAWGKGALGASVALGEGLRPGA